MDTTVKYVVGIAVGLFAWGGLSTALAHAASGFGF
jgi:hypothetical protein